MSMYRYEKATGPGWVRDRGLQGWAETRGKIGGGARQVRVYSEAGELVWEGPGRECPEREPGPELVSIDWGCDADAWWEAADACEVVPDGVAPLVGGHAQAHVEIGLSPGEAFEARRWAQGLPGWSPKGAPARSPHPLFFRPAGGA